MSCMAAAKRTRIGSATSDVRSLNDPRPAVSAGLFWFIKATFIYTCYMQLDIQSFSLRSDALRVGRMLLVAGALVMTSGCASTPEVVPPDPARLDAKGQVMHFEGVMPAQVLDAVETVMRRHRPKGRISRNDDSVVMEASDSSYYLLFWDDYEEKWVVVVREAGVTVASVTMWIRKSGMMYPFGSYTSEYPQSANWGRSAVEIDYGMFWRRVRSILNGEAWPECGKPKAEVGAHFYEPLCNQYTVNASE